MVGLAATRTPFGQASDALRTTDLRVRVRGDEDGRQLRVGDDRFCFRFEAGEARHHGVEEDTGHIS